AEPCSSAHGFLCRRHHAVAAAHRSGAGAGRPHRQVSGAVPSRVAPGRGRRCRRGPCAGPGAPERSEHSGADRRDRTLRRRRVAHPPSPRPDRGRAMAGRRAEGGRTGRRTDRRTGRGPDRWLANQATELTEVPNTDGEVSGACTHGRLALASASSPDSAGDLHLLGGGTTRRLTDFSAAPRAQAPRTELREAAATTAHGYAVRGRVAVPGGLRPHPVVLLIRGGPHSHYAPALFDEVQTYAAAGYAVVFCNPRRSAGYGQAHGQAITHAMGAKDAEDVLSFLDHALADERLDAGRVGVMGGSYGGYLSAWLTTRTHRFAAAIVERGFLDPVSFVGTSDIGWYFPIAYVGTDPER